jgi:hypothetical protein
MTRSQAAAGAGALVVLILLATLLLSRAQPVPPASPSTQPTAALPSPTATTVGSPVHVQLEADDELTAAIDGFLTAIPVSPVAAAAGKPADEVWRESQAKGDQPLDFALALDQTIRANGPAGAAQLLLDGMDEAGERYLFVAAKTLAGRIDRPAALRLLEGLPDADPRVRPHVVFALRGSAEPEVDQALVDLYQSDEDAKVQTRAGSNLGDRLERLSPELRERALSQARERIQDSSREQYEAAADVLGGAPLNDRDRGSLEAVVTTGVDPARRMAALRALATSGLSPTDLQGVLRQVRNDPSAGEQLQALAAQLLGE